MCAKAMEQTTSHLPLVLFTLQVVRALELPVPTAPHSTYMRHNLGRLPLSVWPVLLVASTPFWGRLLVSARLRAT